MGEGMNAAARLAKNALKAVTTPRMRDGIKKTMLQCYSVLFFSGTRAIVNRLPFGVNLIGHIRGDFGLGQSCRLVAGALYAREIPCSIVNIFLNGPASETNTDWLDQERTACPYRVNLVHLNPGELSNALWFINPSVLRGRYNIAYWLWELPEFPNTWDYTFRLFNEIWTPAEFVSEAIRKRTDKPVYTMPYGLTVPETERRFDRAHFGLPMDRFLYLISYDGNSVSDRKNPEGAIRAFQHAFPKGSGNVGLVIKATHEKDGRLERMLAQLEGHHVTVLTKSYSKVEFNSLLACADVYVSLHRAEGFGLVMAEAMLLGTPVIATNWSANTEFMNKDTACMVDAEAVALEKDCPPYRKGYHWAEPDEEQAALWMRRLYRDSAFRERLSRQAKAHLSDEFSPQRAGERMKKRLDELRIELER